MQRILQRYLDRSPSTDVGARLVRAVVLLLLGASVGVGAAAADIYLHRGIESGAEQPYVIHPTGKEAAVNVDLAQFDGDQLQQVGISLASNGFRYVRQTLAWSDIEPVKGQFTWDRYDQIVEVMRANGVEVVAVLARSPGWARAPETATLPDAPPLYSSDFAAFVGQVVRHYDGSIRFFQLWDLPNRPDRWGGSAARPADYVRLLAEAFNAARGANSEARIVLAELSPTYESGQVGSDIRFLRGIYEEGGSPFFDIVAVQLDGGIASPYDRQVSNARASMSRAVIFRELLIEYENRGKPIWFTHYGWSSGEGGVTQEEQADFTIAGLKRARAEWPWVGLVFNWSLLPDEQIPGSAARSLLHDGGFATPAFTALSDLAAGEASFTAGTGFVPMESSPISTSGNWADQFLNEVSFRTTSETGASTTLRFRGTGVIALLRISPQAGQVLATIDGEPVAGWPQQDGAALIDLSAFQADDLPIELASGLDDSIHTLTLSLAGPGQFTIGGLVVSREPPLLWPVIILIVIALGIVAAGLRDVIYVIALHGNILQRRIGVDLRPPLPRLPDWRPARRF